MGDYLPIMPGEDTTTKELLETLRDAYEYRSFDVAMLGEGGRSKQQEDLDAILNEGLLQHGSVVHAEGPGTENQGTASFLKYLEERQFETIVHQADGGSAVVVSKFHGRDGQNSRLKVILQCNTICDHYVTGIQGLQA